MSPTNMRAVVRMLGYLQDYLESEIECHSVPPTVNGKKAKRIPATDKAILARARRRWKEAEDMVQKISTSLNITA